METTANNTGQEKSKRNYIRTEQQIQYYQQVKDLAVVDVCEFLEISNQHKLLFSVRDRNALYGRGLVYYILREFGSSLRVTSDLFEYNCNISHISQILAEMDEQFKKPQYENVKQKVATIIDHIKTKVDNGTK